MMHRRKGKQTTDSVMITLSEILQMTFEDPPKDESCREYNKRMSAKLTKGEKS